MTVDSHWLTTRIEDFLNGDLSAEEQLRADSHLRDCPACLAEVQSLKEIDPLVSTLFRQKLAVARAGAPVLRLRRGVMAMAVSAVAVIVAVGLVSLRPSSETQPPEVAAVATSGVQTLPDMPVNEVEKVGDVPEVSLLKPDIRPAAPGSTAVPAPSTKPDGATSLVDFAVMDPAGYIKTLNDYRGRVLLFGRWSSERPETIASMERIYQTFGKNPTLRIVGVSDGRQSEPRNATFPRVTNHDSRLLDAKESEFVILDSAGTVVLRGSLLADSRTLLNSIRPGLASLNIR